MDHKKPGKKARRIPPLQPAKKTQRVSVEYDSEKYCRLKALSALYGKKIKEVVEPALDEVLAALEHWATHHTLPPGTALKLKRKEN